MMMPMFAPSYCNNVEIRTFGNTKEGDVVVLRFYYQEPAYQEKKLEKDDPMRPPPIPVAGVIMSRAVAKEVLKKFFTFMAIQDEHGLPPIKGEGG